MIFEWDATKNEVNMIKHGISFEEACLIFDGEVLSDEDIRRDYGETRILSIGAISGLIVIVVVHTNRLGMTRIISARLANRRERQKYNDHLRRPPERAAEPPGR